MRCLPLDRQVVARPDQLESEQVPVVLARGFPRAEITAEITAELSVTRQSVQQMHAQLGLRADRWPRTHRAGTTRRLGQTSGTAAMIGTHPLAVAIPPLTVDADPLPVQWRDGW